MNGAVVYCRTANGGVGVIEQQLEKLRWYGKENGFNITAEYCDCNVSGLDIDKPELQKLMNDISAGEVDCLIVCDLSRLARNFLHTNELIGVFDKYGVELISVNDGGAIDMEWTKQLSKKFMALAKKELKRLKRKDKQQKLKNRN